MHRSYVEKEWIDNYIANHDYPLPFEVTKRFFSVVRIKSHEIVAVFDGCGRMVKGVLELTGDKMAVFRKASLEKIEPSSPKIYLVQAALEEGKISETIKRGSEFDVDHFIIFDAKRSEKFCFTKLKAKHERLMRVAQDACRQSERLFIPAIDFVDSIASVVKTEAVKHGLGLFGELGAHERLSDVLQKQSLVTKDIFIVVGPEGGLTADESSTLLAQGFLKILWAPFILRSELAGLSAVAIVNAFLGRA